MVYMFLVFAAVALCSAAAEFNSTTLGAKNGAVADVDIDSYLGLWYQMYADSYVTKSFEKDAYCDTAMYTLLDDGKIGVRNYAKTGSPGATGTDYVIEGYAYQSNPDIGGELKVHFEATEANPRPAPFDAPYWILNLGPIVDGKYDWAVVSDNLSAFLFVLARDVKTFKSKYETEVLEILKKEGFSGALTSPQETYQGDKCVYESSSVKSTSKGASCDDISDKETCMSTMESDEACAWCESGAVGTSCQKQSDAESLPSAVFECSYQQMYAAY